MKLYVAQIKRYEYIMDAGQEDVWRCICVSDIVMGFQNK